MIRLESDMSDVIALDQATLLFFSSESDKNVALIFCKVRRLSFQYTHVSLVLSVAKFNTLSIWFT